MENQIPAQTIQERMAELRKIPQENESEIRQKMSEVITALLKQDTLFVALSPHTKPEDYGSDQMSPLFTLDRLKRPGLWFFSEEPTAKVFAEKSGLFLMENGEKNTEKPLFRAITPNVAAGLAYQAMFLGALDILIDDGSLSLITSAADFINFAFLASGKDKLMSNAEAIFIDTINTMRSNKLKVFVIADKLSKPFELMNNEFKCDVTGGSVRIFTNRETAEKYAQEVLGHLQYCKEATLEVLVKALLRLLPDRMNYRIELFREPGAFRLEYMKAIKFLEKMGILQAKQAEPTDEKATEDKAAEQARRNITASSPAES